MVKDCKKYDDVVDNLSEELHKLLKDIPCPIKEKVEEIRLRAGKPLTISYGGKDYFLNKYGKVISDPRMAVLVGQDDIRLTYQIVNNYSVYAFTEEIRQGYITIRGGHRVGIGGKVVYGHKGIEKVKDISSLNIRIGREKLGISDDIIPVLLKEPREFYNTLIVSPPQCGKTTLLRDIVRNLSNGHGILRSNGFKVTVIDERSELAGVYNGMAQNDIGIRTDILDGCLKSDGIMMAIRSLSPDIIAVDEIGSRKDVDAINEALRAGVKLIATIHGSSLEEIMERSSMEEIFKERIFKRFIIMDRSKGVGTIKEIIDGNTYKSIEYR